MFDHGVGGYGGAHCSDFLYRQFARQHQLREADIGQEARLLRRADVALRGGVQVERRKIEFQQSHVLHDQRIHADVVAVMREFARCFQFVIVQDGVECDENFRVETVGEVHQFGDVFNRIARLVARAEQRPADIDGIRAVQDGFAADGGGFCWCKKLKGGGEEFEGLGRFRHC